MFTGIHGKFLIVLMLLSCYQLQSQTVGNPRFENWQFGKNWEVKFETTPPYSTKNAAIYQGPGGEGCTSISDQGGELQFYSNGLEVWGRNHNVMPNGSGLLGDNSSTMSAIILPVLYNQDKYYILTVDAEGSSYQNGLNYSIIDMTMNNGFGDIVPGKKNIHIADSVSEKVIAIKGVTDKEYWIIFSKLNDSAFYSYKVTCNGINNNPIVSNEGMINGKIGYMKPNNNGSKIAIPIQNSSGVQFLDFNNNNGKLSNATIVNQNMETAYGIEFSPNDTFLYVSDMEGSSVGVYRYDLFATNIPQSEMVLANNFSGGGSLGAIQLATDGKIYIKNAGHLDNIPQPNNSINPGYHICPKRLLGYN